MKRRRQGKRHLFFLLLLLLSRLDDSRLAHHSPWVVCCRPPVVLRLLEASTTNFQNTFSVHYRPLVVVACDAASRRSASTPLTKLLAAKRLCPQQLRVRGTALRVYLDTSLLPRCSIVYTTQCIRKMPPKKGKRKDDFDFDNPEAELASLSMADGPAAEPAAPKQGKAKGGDKAGKHVEIEAPSMMDAAVDEDDAPAGGAAKKGKDKKKKNKGKEDFDFDDPPSVEDIAAAAAEAQASKAATTPKAKSGFAALMGDDEDDAEEEDADDQQAKLSKEQEKAAAKEKARQEKEAEKARQEEEKQRQKEAKEREKEAKKAAAALELAARVIPEHLKAEVAVSDLKKVIQKIGFPFKKVVVAKVVSVSPHPKADNMCVVTVNNGRNDVVVVCSDTTVQPGQLVPFAPVGSEIEDPETQMSFDVTARKLRGIDSYGMLCR